MEFLNRLIAYNRQWSKDHKAKDEAYFTRMALGQEPECLWIGCADSRVPPALISGLGLGEMFTHRNVANVVSPTDNNFLSVLQYAVDVLRVDHVVICGHYGCGGVQAALTSMPPPPLGAWLHEVLNVRVKHESELNGIEDDELRWRRLCELNVKAQIETLAATHTIQHAWARDQQVVLHGLMFDINTGLLSDMKVSRFGNEK